MIRSPFVLLGGALALAALASTTLLGTRPRPVAAAGAGPEAAMTDAARRFLRTLTPEKRQLAAFPFQSEERFNWQFRRLKERKGLPLKDMDAAQRAAAMELLGTGLSTGGLKKAAAIRELEKVPTVEEGKPPPVTDPEGYYFSVFGEPSPSGNWAWRYEGHHCALNWTVAGGKAVASSPQFFGCEPAEVRVEVPGAPAKGTRALPAEEDLGRRLVKSLLVPQQAEAVRAGEPPTNIVTGAARQAAIQEDTGIAYSRLTGAQREMLLSLIREYTNSQSRELAEQRLAALRKAGLDSIKFAWMGGTEPGQGHYYRVQGPTFLIEYDNTQNNANHVHSVWRDFKGDFGMDLLAMHYQATPHRVAAAR